MDDFKTQMAPLTDSLPPEVRDFLDAGGWWVVLGLAALVVLLLVWAAVDRTVRRLFRQRPRSLEEVDHEFHENLADFPPPSATEMRRLTLYHLPVRLRLVVMAAIGTDAAIKETTALQLLDGIVPASEKSRRKSKRAFVSGRRRSVNKVSP